MTLEVYRSAFLKACLTRHDPSVMSVIRPYFEAHCLHVARIESQVKTIQANSCKENETVLRTYRVQQQSSHMHTERSVEEFYCTALEQIAGEVSIFMSVNLALESRQSSFELQKEVLLTTMKKGISTMSHAPLKIVALVFENTSTQHELKGLIKIWLYQNALRFNGLNEAQFLKAIVSLDWSSASSPDEKVSPCIFAFHFQLWM